MAASPEMSRFFEYLSKHSEAQDRFRNIGDQNQAIGVAVTVAKEGGFNIGADDMRGWLDAESAEGKLGKEQLEQVAGGAACWTKTAYHTCPCESGYCASGC